MDGFALRGLGMQYNCTPVLRDVTLAFNDPQLVAVAGPNGAGKSTLLGIMAGLQPHYQGSCRFGGQEIAGWSRRAFARRVSFVPQSLRVEFPFSAEQLVLMGRTPFCDGLFESPEDRRAAGEAMELTDTLEFRRRDVRSLSGGERQRVILAAALAQQPEVLLLDEPTTFLDLKHQISIYRLLGELSRRGLLVIAVTHDLNLAAAFAGRIVLLHGGRVAADAAPSEVLSPHVIGEVFGVESRIHRGADGKPWILYG